MDALLFLPDIFLSMYESICVQLYLLQCRLRSWHQYHAKLPRVGWRDNWCNLVYLTDNILSLGSIFLCSVYELSVYLGIPYLYLSKISLNLNLIQVASVADIFLRRQKIVELRSSIQVRSVWSAWGVLWINLFVKYFTRSRDLLVDGWKFMVTLFKIRSVWEQ